MALFGLRRRIKQALTGPERSEDGSAARRSVQRGAVPTDRPVPAARAASSPPPSTSGSGLAAAARAAASQSVKTSATFRGTDQANGTNDPVLGTVTIVDVITDGPHGPFWGPVDNESARAKATGDTLGIDRVECIGCGTCVEHIDTVFYLDDDACKAHVVSQDGAMDRIQDAIDACPVTCISWGSDAIP